MDSEIGEIIEIKIESDVSLQSSDAVNIITNEKDTSTIKIEFEVDDYMINGIRSSLDSKYKIDQGVTLKHNLLLPQQDSFENDQEFALKKPKAELIFDSSTNICYEQQQNVTKEHNYFNKKLFNCTKCSFSFDGNSKLKVLQCTECDCNVKNKKQCAKCSYNTTNRKNFLKHVRTHMTQKSFRCELCSSQFIFQSELEEHIIHHSDKKSFHCSDCDIIFIRKSSLVAHLYHKHCIVQKKLDNIELKCVHCNYKTFSKQNLKRHAIKHSSDKRFKCNKCDLAFATRPRLKHHMTKHSDVKPFQCPECSSSFKQKSSLSSHKIAYHFAGLHDYKWTRNYKL